ncbi:MAG: hypothetical protein U1F36_21965 [Planctomycetota bacterium]
MVSVGERSFHLLLGTLLVLSLLVGRYARTWFPGWSPPQVDVITLVIGLVWVGRYAAWRGELSEETKKVADDRFTRLERRLDALEDELRARRRSF